jgi:DNA-directed RNA polymerase subunit RPC12/RpoP
LIIACPECTSPFQVLDDQIAPLLQIECPTCSFRMILDFAAANDAGLRENGMQYAQGFLDEASYRMAVGGEVSYAASEPPAARGEAPAAKPELRAVPEPEPTVEPEPEPEPQTPPAWTPAVAEPEPERPAPVQPQPEPARAKPPVRARPTLIAHTAPPPVRQPAELIPPRPEAEPAEAAIDTHVGPAPRAEVAAPIEVPRPADDAQLEVPADEFSVDLDEPVEPEVQVTRPRPQPIEQPIQHDEPQLRTPPHTPATPSTTKPIPDETGGEDEATEAPEVDSKTPQPEQTGKKGGALRTVFLMLLLLVLMGAAGLMGWSVIETQDPNPLPMLKDKFGIDLGFGIPPEAADKAAGDKAGAQ